MACHLASIIAAAALSQLKPVVHHFRLQLCLDVIKMDFSLNFIKGGEEFTICSKGSWPSLVESFNS
jgi:hypothetical protein